MENTCYICCEETPPAPPSACACRGRYLHLHCQMRLVQHKGGSDKCSVCLQPYSNLKMTVRRYVQPTFLGHMLIACILIQCILGLLAVIYNNSVLPLTWSTFVLYFVVTGEVFVVASMLYVLKKTACDGIRLWTWHVWKAHALFWPLQDEPTAVATHDDAEGTRRRDDGVEV